MGESLFRRNPTHDFLSVMSSRRDRAKTETEGGPALNKSRVSKDSAYIYITGTCNKCDGEAKKTYTIPKDETTWEQTYGKDKFKPSPIVQKVAIEYGGDWGLAQKITGTIQCFTRADFKLVTERILLPGNFISVRFGKGAGSSRQWSPNSKEVTLSGFRTAVFGFSTGDHGSWICTFTAVSSATALKNVDMLASVNGAGLKYFVAGEQEGMHSAEVKSIMELIECDAQRNGQESAIRMDNGQVIANADLSGYNTKHGKAALIVYTGDHLLNTVTKSSSWTSFLGFTTNNNTQEANNQIYVTLGYIVNRIFNDRLLPKFIDAIPAPDKQDFLKLSIKFHKDYSKSKVPKDLRSGDPLTVLLLGNSKGDYLNSSGVGKDFEKDVTSPKDVQCLSGDGIVELDKILVHKSLVQSALANATKTSAASSDSTAVKNTPEEVISMVDFFKKLFDGIGDSTGGALSLRLVEDVDDVERNTLIVVDQNNGGNTPIKCFILDPINGDGSTLTCDIQSNVGSEEYKASMFLGNSKKGGPASVLRGCETKVDSVRELEYAYANLSALELINDPGELGRSGFDGKSIDALKSLMAHMYKNRPDPHHDETVHWPGMRLSATLDGVYGLIPGCAISSTQLLNEWRTKGLYFMVTSVVHSFERSVWVTSVEGIMAYYNNLKSV